MEQCFLLNSDFHFNWHLVIADIIQTIDFTVELTQEMCLKKHFSKEI